MMDGGEGVQAGLNSSAICVEDWKHEFFQVKDSGESARLGLQKEESVDWIVRL